MQTESKNELYFEETGTDNKETIVLLHGGGISGWMWRRHAAILSRKYHCLVPDLPEQGGSLAVAPFSVEFAADCVTELIRNHAHGGRAHVVGLSEGAQVTVAMLSRYPERIDHAVVSSAILRPMPSQSLYKRGLFAWSYRWFMRPFNKNDWWIRLNMHSAAGIDDEYYDDFKKSFQETTESGFANLMYEAMHFRLPAGLERADLPVLVITGALEYKQMKESARDLLNVLPHAVGATVSFGKGSSLAKEHNWALTDPEFFTDVISAWIRDDLLPARLLPFTYPL